MNVRNDMKPISNFSELVEIANGLSSSHYGEHKKDLPFNEEEFIRKLMKRFSDPKYTSAMKLKETIVKAARLTPFTFSLLSKICFFRFSNSIAINARSMTGQIGKRAYSDFLAHLSEYEQVFNMLSDETSQLLFLNALYARMVCITDFNLLMDDDFENMQQYNARLADTASGDTRDFIVPGEVFVDCGAFTGDTLAALLELAKKPKKYFGFEPEKTNYLRLEKTIGDIGDGFDCYIKQAGVSDAAKDMRFNSGRGSSGGIEEKGKDIISVVALDDEIHEPVTLIKMDIEGHEVPAIRGAAGLIQRYKPKLAICIYHRFTDFRLIPKLIKQINPEYANFLFAITVIIRTLQQFYTFGNKRK